MNGLAIDSGMVFEIVGALIVLAIIVAAAFVMKKRGQNGKK